MPIPIAVARWKSAARGMRRDTFCIELIDAGIPFDMLARPAPDLTVDAVQRAVGGLGIPLIRALMDNVTYHREGARNILRLTALLPQ